MDVYSNRSARTMHGFVPDMGTPLWTGTTAHQRASGFFLYGPFLSCDVACGGNGVVRASCTPCYPAPVWYTGLEPQYSIAQTHGWTSCTAFPAFAISEACLRTRTSTLVIQPVRMSTRVAHTRTHRCPTITCLQLCSSICANMYSFVLGTCRCMALGIPGCRLQASVNTNTGPKAE